MAPATRRVSGSELARHGSASSCWLAIEGRVYDCTAFVAQHPGGVALLLSVAGRDSTAAFQAAHGARGAALLQEWLPAGALIGELDPDEPTAAAPTPGEAAGSGNGTTDTSTRPPLGAIINVSDMEAVARAAMDPYGWDYYSSGAETETTLRENTGAFRRLFLRPRVLRPVRDVSTACTVLGQPCAAPLYISASALVGMAHPEAECLLMRAAGARSLPYMVPTLSSKPLGEIAAARSPGQPAFFQLYVSSERERTAAIVQQAEQLGFQGLFVTVDVAWPGRRESDMRNRFTSEVPHSMQGEREEVSRSAGVMGALRTFFDPNLSWDDLAWLRSLTSMPIVLKGIQTGEDAVLAAKHPLVAGIVVSNHGGRQLDFARSSIEVLSEVMAALRAEGLQGQLEVYLDGGIRRGTDVFKALAMGARAVGMARPVLWGAAGYGQPGAERVLDMLREELVTTMRLMGTRSLAEIGTAALAPHPPCRL